MADEDARSGNWVARLAPALAAACLVLLLVWNLGGSPLLEPDEGRYTEIPREMLARGDFVTPHLNGVLYFEKPPLHYWLNAAAIGLFGLTEFAARAWSALFGLAGIALAWCLGRSVGGRRAGFLAAAALGTSPLWVGTARLATLDMTVTFFLTATLACFWFAQEAEDGRRRLLAWHGMFAAAALAVLAKGLIGIVIPGAVVFLYLLATRQWVVLKRVPWVTGIVLFFAIAAPWHVLAASRNPDFLWFYFVHEHLLRYATPIAERHEPFWYFLAVVVLGCAPWSGLLPSAARLLPWRRVREGLAEHRGEAFLLIWAAFVVVFFSVSQSKLIPYVLPALPPLAALVGVLIDRLWDGRLAASRWETAGLVAGGVLAALYGAAFVWAGLGKIDRLGLGGVVSPDLLVPGALVLAVALLAAASAFGRAWNRRVLALFAAGCCVGAAVQVVAPLVARERSSKTVAERLRPELRPGDLIFAYRCFPESLPVYLERTVGVAACEGELAFGISHLNGAERKERFPTAEQFRDLWESDRRVFVVGETQSWSRRLAQDGITHARLLWEGEGLALLSNERPAP
ncbi:MAG: glycosyltransferase family 39 protein [Thermoanaerobaculaceae bacterium]|jgi:4-amino-4-deoxy-L-arabinose transferase-like glycosyltransferase